MQNKVLSLLGLAAKSGKVASGEFSTEQAIKQGKSFLVLIAEDASENTGKHFSDMAVFYQVPIYRYGTKEELGAAIGKEFRASVSVNDENLAKALENKLQSEKLNNGGNN